VLGLVALCAVNVACFVQYSNWKAACVGVFAGVQIAFFVTNAPEVYSYSALIVAYIGIATQNARAIAICANALSVSLYVVIAVGFLRQGNKRKISKHWGNDSL